MRIAAALILNGLLAAALLEPAVTPRVHPVAPPLTRISVLGDHPIGGEGPPPSPGWRFALEQTLRAVGTPAQQAELSALRPPPRPGPEGRAVLQQDAVAIGALLGDARIAALLARRETLGDLYGEGRVWDEIAP